MINIAEKILISIFGCLQKSKNEGLDGGSELTIRKPLALPDVLQNLFQVRIICESLIHPLLGWKMKILEHLSTQCAEVVDIGNLGWIEVVDGKSKWKCNLVVVG